MSKEYEFHHIADVRVIDEAANTMEMITVSDDKLDDLRPYSKILFEQEWKIYTMRSNQMWKLAAYERQVFQIMIKIYAEIMKLHGAEVKTYKWR